MMQIITTNGHIVILNKSDFSKVCNHTWYALKNRNTYYAVRKVSLGISTLTGKQIRQMLYMHRVIMDTPPNKITDHRDGNGLNNTRYNLRVCTVSQNNQNRKKQNKPALSQYKGVTYNKKDSRWIAQIWFDHNNNFLGGYANEIDAAIAYNKKASELFGKFALLNIIPNDI
jgi:hypothetical protein